MSGQVSRGSAREYQADERAGVAGSAGEYQADELAGVAGLSWRLLEMTDFLPEVLTPESEMWLSGVDSHGHVSQNQGESRLRSVKYITK